jgi:hypothetical protein
METLSTLSEAISDIIQDSSFTSTINKRINDARVAIAGGIYMPDKSISPPLPDLYKYGTVDTSTTLPYVSLPSDYQRKVTMIVDSAGVRYSPPPGGDYYAFKLFLNNASDKTLAETGSIYRVAIKGNKLYYQGIPTAAETIGLHYYSRPVDLAVDGDIPEELPEHLQLRLIKHYVCKEIFGEMIEDGQDNAGVGVKYHTGKFMEAMLELVEFIGTDGEPQYYGDDCSQDGGVCD